MRSLVLADIHANIDALDAVLAAAEGLRIDQVILLGDLVGYNASPAAVLRRIESLDPTISVRGNHDKVCAGLESAFSFQPLARQAIEWTRRQLSPADLTTLAALPQGPLLVSDTTEICHGAPFDEDFYVMNSMDARRALEAMTVPLCLFGHTHVPSVFVTHGFAVRQEWLRPDSVQMIPWPAEGRALVNVGAVGQPRDGDPRAAFGVLDDGARTIELRRVTYDVAAAQRRILDAGLPASNAERLASGN
jgi:diadenosine tetraphosphatase ApaH/serine/threonine PP2A family protein phosphatase